MPPSDPLDSPPRRHGSTRHAQQHDQKQPRQSALREGAKQRSSPPSPSAAAIAATIRARDATAAMQRDRNSDAETALLAADALKRYLALRSRVLARHDASLGPDWSWSWRRRGGGRRQCGAVVEEEAEGRGSNCANAHSAVPEQSALLDLFGDCGSESTADPNSPSSAAAAAFTGSPMLRRDGSGKHRSRHQGSTTSVSPLLLPMFRMSARQGLEELKTADEENNASAATTTPPFLPTAASVERAMLPQRRRPPAPAPPVSSSSSLSVVASDHHHQHQATTMMTPGTALSELRNPLFKAAAAALRGGGSEDDGNANEDDDNHSIGSSSSGSCGDDDDADHAAAARGAGSTPPWRNPLFEKRRIDRAAAAAEEEQDDGGGLALATTPSTAAATPAASFSPRSGIPPPTCSTAASKMAQQHGRRHRLTPLAAAADARRPAEREAQPAAPALPIFSFAMLVDVAKAVDGAALPDAPAPASAQAPADADAVDCCSSSPPRQQPQQKPSTLPALTSSPATRKARLARLRRLKAPLALLRAELGTVAGELNGPSSSAPLPLPKTPWSAASDKNDDHGLMTAVLAAAAPTPCSPTTTTGTATAKEATGGRTRGRYCAAVVVSPLTTQHHPSPLFADDDGDEQDADGASSASSCDRCWSSSASASPVLSPLPPRR